jgi:hypothetical protein
VIKEDYRMTLTGMHAMERREFLIGALAAGVMLSLPGKALAQADPAAEAVKKLRVLATQDALNRLGQPQGFWNSSVARFGLPVLFVKRGAVPAGPLAQADFRFQLQYRLNSLAEAGARGAVPTVAEAARKAAVTNGYATLHGRPTAATSELRAAMGSDLVNAIRVPLEQTLIAAQDPIVAQAVAVLPGVTLGDVAHAVALAADNGIWYEIGLSEADIRANPSATGDAELIAALAPPAPVAPAALVPAPATTPAPVSRP